MTEIELSQLKKLIVIMAYYYGKDMRPDVVTLIASDLSDLPFDQVKTAFDNYRRADQRMQFPSTGKIRQMVRPEINPIDLARDTGLRIRDAVTKYGSPNHRMAMEYIGLAGWHIVERFGGWQHLCENLGTKIQEGTFIAQCRDAVESMINLGAAGVDTQYPSIEQANDKTGIISIGEITKLLVRPK